MSSERPEQSNSLNSETYRISFDHLTRSAIMPIARPTVVNEIKASALRDGFQEKSEFHVTVIPRDIANNLSDEEVEQLYHLISDCRVNDLKFVGSVYKVNKSKVVEDTIYPRESLIVRVDSSRLLRCLGAIGTFTSLQVLYPFFHVTLFVKGDNEYAERGIGIPTIADFTSLSPELYVPAK